MRLYDHLFTDPQPDAGGKNFLGTLNTDSLKMRMAVVETVVFNQTMGLKDG